MKIPPRFVAALVIASASPALAQEPGAPASSASATQPVEHSQMAHAMAGHGMRGAFGDYPMTREASGTAWQPDASEHAGVHFFTDGWTIMTHANLNLVYDSQSGPRGDDKGFVSGMLMGIARRELESGDAIQFRAMVSPDPFMGADGYPLLLATGETADGVTPLVDRQHPHDLFMELSASYSHLLSEKASVFIYGGLPGEPAFGPPAFMHRLSVMDSPEAPISHHWLDSTHITFGVVTAGFIYDNLKIEASRFHGREPDEHRFDIETGALDSTAVRLSWNPSPNWSLQASWADQKSPEQLEPEADIRRWSASAIYTVPFGEAGWWSTTATWGRRTSEADDLDAYVLESAVKLNDAWTIFGRAERTKNNELAFVMDHAGPAFTVSKASLGAVRDWQVARHVKIGLGGLFAYNWVPSELDPLYGGSPRGVMVFTRLKIN